MSTSSGSRVRRLGTIAISSNPYARRPDFPIPISTSTCPPELQVASLEDRGYRAARRELCSPSVFVVGQLVRGSPGRVVRVCGRVLDAIAEPGDAVGVGHFLLPAA